MWIMIHRRTKILKRILLICFVFLFGFSSAESQDSDLYDKFRDPGNEARPRAYWNWLNGAVSLAAITRDMEEAKAKGLGGLLIWDVEAMRNPDGFVPAGPPFMGDESVEAIKHAIKEAQRLSLELGLVASSGWNSGGTWVTPEMAGKNLFSAGIVVSGPDQVKEKLPFPEVPPNCPMGPDGLPRWYMDVAVLAWPDSGDKIISDISEVRSITDHFKDGELVWAPPPGKWQVVRFVCSNNGQRLIAASPNSKGLFIDFLDPEATRFHFEYFIQKLGLSKGNNPGMPLKSLDDDSMELHEGIQWTADFPKWFKTYHGYDPVKWLPVLTGWTIEDEDESGRFHYDYTKTVSDLLIYSHYTTGRELLNEYGLDFTAEAGGPGPPIWDSCPVDALKALGHVDIPRGEFWMGNPRHIFLIKEIASAAHIYGKPFVDAESWTTWRRWRDGLVKRKMLVDRAFCEGLNRVTYHGFSHSPEEAGYPGRSYHAGIDMNPQVAWWPKAKPFMDYLGRCCHMLQQGTFVADVAYYYGDQAPNFWPMHHDVPEKPRLQGLGPGFDYDVVNTDVILNRMSVKDGRIVLPDGMSYRVLVLPDQPHMPLDVLAKLEILVSAGATIIGPKPSEVPGLHEHQSKTAALRQTAAKMWGQCDGSTVKHNTYGKGTVVWGYTPGQWLAGESVMPDFSCKTAENTERLDYIHRKADDLDIYFIRNKTKATVNAECLFRVQDSAPQIWDPADGTKKQQFISKRIDERTSLPLILPPGGSVFVVFDENAEPVRFTALSMPEEQNDPHLPDTEIVTVTGQTVSVLCRQNGKYVLTDESGPTETFDVRELPAPMDIKGEWTVEFDEEWGAPPEVKLPELISWTDHSDEGVRYYSGKGTYRKTIEVPTAWLAPGLQVLLDLGDVREIAEIFVNGQSAGIVWNPPYLLEISSYLKPGRNTLKVEVMNLWINRLTGDLDLPESEQFTRTNIKSDGSTRYSKAEPWHVEPAGLLGPVRLLPSTIVSVTRSDAEDGK
jgi:hypothetical protein